ncbi:E3 SUMO-protein ligase ZBED1-like [Bacillus rossius redtenbacheri]|uniref:E3 SUMO-protein ligase ZBED1-like n=1 Tax=Bacillus rossius redtenbacheri TaxID=93214 RepID=UPI002FDE3323
MGRRKSSVWTYFEKKTDTSAVCLLCKKVYQSKNNTSNLHEHLNRKHMTVLQAAQLIEQVENFRVDDPDSEPRKKLCTSNASQQNLSVDNPGISSSSVSVTASSSETGALPQFPASGNALSNSRINTLVPRQLTLHSSYRLKELPEMQKKKLDNMVAALVYKDLQTLSIVEDEGFKLFIRELEPRYSLPTRRTLTRKIIPELYTLARQQLQNKLNDVEYVAITTDVWTSLNTQSFMTVTVHFVANNEMQSAVLETKVLVENHTALYLSSVLKSLLTEWNLINKITAVITDGGPNIKAAVKIVGLAQHPCCAHMLNLVVNDAINKNEDLKQILCACRALVGHFKSSVVAADKLRAIQNQLQMTQLKMKQDVQTRWNSTYIMLERLTELKEPLSAVLASLPTAPSALLVDQWQVIEDCVPVLKIFNLLTIEFSAEKYPTISKVIPLVRGVQMKLQTVSMKTAVGCELKRNLLEGLSSRFSQFEKGKISSIATFVDPRFKKMGFRNDANAACAQELVMKEVQNLCTRSAPQHVSEIEPSCTNISAESDDLWEFFDSKVCNLKRNSNPGSDATITVRQYIESPYQDRKLCPLSYWKKHKNSMPHMYQIAHKPASSVPSERVFSKAGQIMSERRNRIKPKNMDILIFLNGQ